MILACSGENKQLSYSSGSTPGSGFLTTPPGVRRSPIISLKKTPSAYGHVTCSKVWQAGGENKYEINISLATLDRPIEETASTPLHEMVHEFCLERSIKDTSNNGVYHNKRFKEQAQAHGLVVSHHDKYGWTITIIPP